MPGTHSLDSIIVGYYRGEELIYVVRVRNSFVPASRRQVFEKLHPLLMGSCPFVNLPETHKGRWGDGLTAKDMEKCIWVRPELVAKIEFLEWSCRGASQEIQAFPTRRTVRPFRHFAVRRSIRYLEVL